MPDAYLPRLAESVLFPALDSFPAISVVGPRATGKTTTASRFAGSILRLDRSEEEQVVRADPDAAIRRGIAPVLIDEWQVVPEVLGAVKRRVDDASGPGQYLITGSVRADLDVATWPGTGRVLRIPMWGLTTRERLRRLGDGVGLVDRLVDGGIAALDRGAPHLDIDGYLSEVLVGAFPFPATELDVVGRERWYESYLDQVMTRDAAMLGEARDPVRLRRYFETCAIHTGSVLDDATLYRAAGVDRRTAVAYEHLLSGLSLIDHLPAWWTNRLKRLTQRPKRFVVDPALAAAALRVDQGAILRDAGILGRLLETFAVAQLRAESNPSTSRYRLHHLRTEQGRHEVDVIAELGGGRVVGIEVKAAAAVNTTDARHLRWLADELGDRFVAGVVLHTGSHTFELGDNIVAAPISSLWA